MKKTEKFTTLTDLILKKSRDKGVVGEINPKIEKLLEECSEAPRQLVRKRQDKDGSEKAESREKKLKEPIKVKYDKKADPRIDDTLFVGNVTLHVSEKELLRKLGLKRSEVESLRFRSLPIHPKFSTKRKVGAALECFSGNCNTKNAYIVLKDGSRMKQIIDEFSGAVLAGNRLRLTPASKGNQFSTFDRKRTVFIGGLPEFCTEDELCKFVTVSLNEDCVSSVRIIKSATTGKPKRFGFVLFNDRKFVISSIKILNGAQFRDSKIAVMRALSEEEAKSKSNSENSRKRIAEGRGERKSGEKNGYISKEKAKKKLNKIKKKLKAVRKPVKSKKGGKSKTLR